MRNREPMTIEQLKTFIYAGKSGFLMTNTETGVSKEYLVVQSRDKKRWYVCVPFVGFIGTLFAGQHAHKLMWSPNSKVRQVSKEFFIFRWLMTQIWEKARLPTNLWVTHNGNCGRCGRKLTDDKSVERGYGPHCWKMLDHDGKFWLRVVEPNTIKGGV